MYRSSLSRNSLSRATGPYICVQHGGGFGAMTAVRNTTPATLLLKSNIEVGTTPRLLKHTIRWPNASERPPDRVVKEGVHQLQHERTYPVQLENTLDEVGASLTLEYTAATLGTLSRLESIPGVFFNSMRGTTHNSVPSVQPTL